MSLCDSWILRHSVQVEQSELLSCHIQAWAAREKNNFSGSKHVAVSSPYCLPPQLQQHDYPLPPEAFTVLNFLIMACLCLGTRDHMASIESVTRLRFGI